MAQISAVIITLNEEESILECLEALRWCSEIIVVDSGSTDRTVDLARSSGCRVEHHNFTGYGAQKRYACSLARYPWILSLDADEVLSADLANEICTTLDDEPRHLVYSLPRRFVFLGKVFAHGRGSCDYPLRLFRKDSAEFSLDTVHEHLITTGSTGRMKHEMLHYSYRSIDHYLEKFNRYTSLAATALVERGKRRSVAATALMLPLYFVKHYLIGGHCLNGWQGLVWSVLSTWYPFVKVAKATDLARKKRN
ncbi:MAG: glycosyltransferase family 2 protein ['Candidatus Kapabacteria' thiocyanatum]|mgnify:CR=1 FL=1|uniref:Glycosyltransferase 2-like domain-containing protein n=1 Tax=Candidatus Kapaibacterium thiocyanatum TaxID=1895771 RepID=A0A1M3L3G9_9BACT|nr:glycosyltransferase family 2 protein ['Candidatus Kapabacteria' thiocyanatum]OJX59904.1 MAG: hypothetical protein BGO89_07845 ['Candidatus Kapabacteria' thiocyanatum]